MARKVDAGRLQRVRQPGVKSEAIVETTDLYPTLAGYAGLPVPAELDGRSLRPILEDAAAPSDGLAFGGWADCTTLRTTTHRLIVSKKKRAHVELYDHAADPGEAVNAAALHPGIVAEMTKQLGALPGEVR